MGKRYLSGLCLAVVVASAAASAAECTKSQAIAAEHESDALKSWAAVHASFGRFAHCDDGAIAEGYDESITVLLANRWGTLPALAKLVAGDPPFEQFVVRHINETVPKERLAKIASNARNHCPGKYRGLCNQLLKATE